MGQHCESKPKLLFEHMEIRSSSLDFDSWRERYAQVSKQRRLHLYNHISERDSKSLAHLASIIFKATFQIDFLHFLLFCKTLFRKTQKDFSFYFRLDN